jgi:hypothetical protein
MATWNPRLDDVALAEDPQVVKIKTVQRSKKNENMFSKVSKTTLKNSGYFSRKDTPSQNI